MKLSQRIRECRYAKGWGPDELAERARISRTALYQIECGRTEAPRAGTLCRIANALGVGVESLLASDEVNLTDQPRSRDGAPSREFGGITQRPWSADDGLECDASLSLAPRISHLATIGSTSTIEVERKFEELLDSPLADAVCRIVEEAYRLLPTTRERSAAV